ncbi:VgrG-related protein [Lelliottia wanjuensis]|uniref:Uncharacterized protein n=2 Tax=Enterobacteriaceae TaxID=543 RepID=A0AAP4LCY4_9ENTR|nr:MULTISPECIES: glycine zipper domain-containing protein [unclassified Lelliottia]MDK9365938.1 hypothetical protein [Lelliottia sp. V106_12]MDK9616194.1 hypothetical protein [Lelliottia sp. V106_9]
MYIGVSKLARAASGGSVKQDKKFIEAINKAVQQSSMVSQKVIKRVTKDLDSAITSGNEQAVILLKKQLESLKVAQALSKTQDAELAKLFQQGQKLNDTQYQQLDKYLQKMTGLSTDLNMVLQTSLSNLSDDIVKAVNGDTSKQAKLHSAKQLAQAIGSSGMFDKSPAFKELLAFTKNQTDLTEQSTKQLIELVDKMNLEVQSVDRLNDLIKIAQDSSKDEKTQIHALNNIIVSLGDSNKFLNELNQLKAIANSSDAMSAKLNKLGPLLKHLETSSLQTRTLHTLQQIEFGLKKSGLSDTTKAKLKSGAAYVGGAAAGKAAEHGSDITKLLMSKIPGLNVVDMATDGAISDKASDIAGIGAGYIGAKTLGKVKGLLKGGGTATRAAESGVVGAAERAALRGGGSKGLLKLLGKGGRLGKLAAAAGAGYLMLSGDDAEAAPMVPQGVAVPESSANPLTEAAIYAAAPKVAAKTGVSALASKGATKAATSLLGEGAGGALAKGAKSVVGKASGIANVAVGAYDYATANNTAERKEAVGSTLGSMIGGAIGTAIPIPVVGTLIGATAGGYIGSKVSEWFAEDPQDNIPDDVKKNGPIAEAVCINDMIKNGDYDNDQIAKLRKYQQSCLSTQNISDYINNTAGGNVQRLMQIMDSSAMPSAYPEVYSAIMDYVNTTVIPNQKDADAKNVQGIGTALDVINQKQDVGKSITSTGGENQPSNSIDSLQIKTQKSITAIDSLPAQDQKQVSDLIDAGIDGSAKADAYVDDAGQHSLVNKLMGWVSNVLPTGIFPMVTMGVSADAMTGGNVSDWLANMFGGGGGGFFGPTKNQPGGVLPPEALNSIKSTVPSTGNEAEDVANTVMAGNERGTMSGYFESRGNVRSISTGAGDIGGVSYGGHQIASKTGTMGEFMRSPQAKAFAGQFAGLTPGTPAFNTAYKQFTSTSEGAAAMDKAQDDFIIATHYNPVVNRVQKNTGVDINKQSKAVQEAAYVSAVAYGSSGGASKLERAFKEAGISGDGQQDQAKMIDTIYQDRIAHIQQDYSKSPISTQRSMTARYQREWAVAKAVLAKENAAKGVTAVDTTSQAVMPMNTGQQTGITPSGASGIVAGDNSITPTAAGITVKPAQLDASSSALVRENEVLKNTRNNNPSVVPSQPAPIMPSNAGSIRPPSNIDDYGLAFANKLLWDN